MKYADMKKWVKALRSGEYKQTQSQLHDDTGFCCLGVLCDLHRKKTKKVGWKNKGDSLGTKKYLDADGVLPRKVMKYYNIKDPSGRMGYLIDDINLADLNDSGKSFKYIANVIEKNYKKL